MPKGFRNKLMKNGQIFSQKLIGFNNEQSRNNSRLNNRFTEVNLVSKLNVSNNLNNTIDIPKVNPITLEINQKRKFDQESDSTFIQDGRNPNTKGNEDGKYYTVSPDMWGVWGQPFENHSLEHNLELVFLNNKYIDIIENTSQDERFGTLKRPGSSVSIRSINSMIK